MVLPAPQISDAELEEVVKLGMSSGDVHGRGGEETNGVSRHLLADYSVTPAATPFLRTPRTPSSEILQEAQTIFALQNVQTPLKSDIGDTSSIQQQNELHAHLRAGLGSLPAPRNDFEIVLPENEVMNDRDVIDTERYTVEDASEIEERMAQKNKAEGTVNVTC